MKKIKVLLLCFFALNLFAQNSGERYSTIGLTMDDLQILIDDHSHGLAIDHFHKNEDALLEFIFSESELLQLTDRLDGCDVVVESF